MPVAQSFNNNIIIMAIIFKNIYIHMKMKLAKIEKVNETKGSELAGIEDAIFID